MDASGEIPLQREEYFNGKSKVGKKCKESLLSEIEKYRVQIFSKKNLWKKCGNVVCKWLDGFADIT